MVRYAAEFGMTPSARSRVTATLMTRSKKTAPPAISDAATQCAQEVVSGKRIAGPRSRRVQAAPERPRRRPRKGTFSTSNPSNARSASFATCSCSTAENTKASPEPLD